MNINLVCVGNLKEKFSKQQQEEYLKRLSAFCKVSIVEVKEQNQLSSSALVLEEEGKLVLKNLKGFCILCDIDAQQQDSKQFAENIASLMQTNSTITFVVGGSFGVSDSVRKACSQRISFSKMTFPHNLFRIMLLEQIYRSFMILNGKSYHK